MFTSKKMELSPPDKTTRTSTLPEKTHRDKTPPDKRPRTSTLPDKTHREAMTLHRWSLEAAYSFHLDLASSLTNSGGDVHEACGRRRTFLVPALSLGSPLPASSLARRSRSPASSCSRGPPRPASPLPDDSSQHCPSPGSTDGDPFPSLWQEPSRPRSGETPRLSPEALPSRRRRPTTQIC
jgi:hypothetical protein